MAAALKKNSQETFSEHIDTNHLIFSADLTRLLILVHNAFSHEPAFILLSDAYRRHSLQGNRLGLKARTYSGNPFEFAVDLSVLWLVGFLRVGRSFRAQRSHCQWTYRTLS